MSKVAVCGRRLSAWSQLSTKREFIRYVGSCRDCTPTQPLNIYMSRLAWSPDHRHEVFLFECVRGGVIPITSLWGTNIAQSQNWTPKAICLDERNAVIFSSQLKSNRAWKRKISTAPNVAAPYFGKTMRIILRACMLRQFHVSLKTVLVFRLVRK